MLVGYFILISLILRMIVLYGAGIAVYSIGDDRIAYCALTDYCLDCNTQRGGHRQILSRPFPHCQALIFTDAPM